MVEKIKFLLVFAIVGAAKVVGAAPTQESLPSSNQAPQINTVSSTSRGSLSEARADETLFSEIKRLIEQGKLPAAIEMLNGMLPAYENDPNYFYLLGDLYFRDHAYAQAAANYERVVLIQSNNAGAWMDLAIAHTEAGNWQIASQFFDYIVDTMRPSKKMMAVIDAFRSRILAREFQMKPWHFQMDYAFGYDTNVNSGLIDKSIYININGQLTPLPLKESFIAQRDTFRNIVLNSSYQGQFLGQELNWGANVANHTLTKEHAYATNDFSSNIGLIHRNERLDVGVNFSAEHLWLSGRNLLNDGNLSMFAEKSWGNCVTNLVFEVERRRYIVAETITSTSTTTAPALNLDANIVWQNFANSCGMSTRYGFLQQTLIVRHGNDQPNGLREGGKTYRNEIIGKLTWRGSNAAQVDFSVNLAHARDVAGYSVLLENNAPRNIIRHIYRMQAQYPLGDNWFGFINLEKNANHANLSIFRQSGESASIGLRKLF